MTKARNDLAGGAPHTPVRIEYIADKDRRMVTASKRCAGLLKKAAELAVLTGGQVLVVVETEAGTLRTFGTAEFWEDAQQITGRRSAIVRPYAKAPKLFQYPDLDAAGIVARPRFALSIAEQLPPHEAARLVRSPNVDAVLGAFLAARRA